MSATIEPCATPIAVVASSASRTQRNHGRSAPFGNCNSATTTPATPLTNATDRSISPIRRTKTTPYAISVGPAMAVMMFVKLAGVKKLGAVMPK